MMRPRRAELLLALGAAAGVGLAAIGVARPSFGEGDRVPEGAVARVNGVSITDDDYQRTVAAIDADRRGGVDAAMRTRAIDRLIDEELLVQRGVELGLLALDRRVRNNLTAAVIDLIVARAEQSYRPPSDIELRRYYDENAFYFRGPDLLHVRQLYVAGADAEQRAADLAQRARSGEPFAALVSDPSTVPLPNKPIPANKLRDYIGPSAARRALALRVGAVSEPIKSAAGARVIRVVDRIASPQPDYDSIRHLVLAEHRRRSGDRALRRFLDRRRGDAHITIAEDRL